MTSTSSSSNADDLDYPEGSTEEPERQHRPDNEHLDASAGVVLPEVGACGPAVQRARTSAALLCVAGRNRPTG